MTGPAARMTGIQFVLRALGIAFGSALAFLLMAAADGGSAAAAASAQPAVVGDVLDGGSGVAGVLRSATAPAIPPAAAVGQAVADAVTPVLEPAGNTVAPVLPPVADAGTPVVEVATPVVTPVVPPVGEVLTPVVEPVTDVVTPVAVTPVVEPITDEVVPVVEPIGDGDTPADPALQPVPPADPAGSADPEPATVRDQPTRTPPVTDQPHPAGAADPGPEGSQAPPADVTATPTGTRERPDAASQAAHVTRPAAGPAQVAPPATTVLEQAAVEVGRSLEHLATIDGSYDTHTAHDRSASNRPSNPFGPLRVPNLPNVVSGTLSAVTSFPSDGGAQPMLLAVLTATLAGMFWFSRRVTAQVSWRSAVVFSSVERPG